jgi:uncharacterized protein (DUF2141 family)
MKRLGLAFLLSLIPTASFAADLSTLTIKIEDVTNKGGSLRVGIYTQDNFVLRSATPSAFKIEDAKPGETTVVFDNLMPGEYGVKAFQDENSNGRLDTVMGVIPVEPHGMSNDAQPMGGGSEWEQAKFVLKPGPTTITIHLD